MYPVLHRVIRHLSQEGSLVWGPRSFRTCAAMRPEGRAWRFWCGPLIEAVFL